MNPWRWVRSRRWWVQLLLAGGVLPIVLVTLYVAGRSIQYAAAERDGGVYVPSTANVVLRARGLEAQLRRLRDSTAWHAFERRILRDPVLRRQINGLLQANGAPTLDDLDDSRKPFAKNQERLIDAIGDDLIGALQVRDSLPKASWCGIVRLRWLHYLAAPFARLALRSEELDGETCLVIRDGGQEIRIVIIGSLAIAANDKALLSQALRRQGREEASDRPIVARAVFENSPALFEVRKAVRDSGVMPFVDWSTARGLKLSADVQDATASLDLLLDKAEPLHSTPPPLELRGWAPLNTSGLLLTNTGGADLMRWLSDLVLSAGPRDFTAQTIQQALKALEDGGLYSHLLPQLNDGMAFVTGLEEREGRSYTAFALLLPSKDPEAAVEALNRMVRKIAGAWGDSKYFTSIPVGDVVLNSWSWPEGLQINDLLSPTYGAVKGMIVLGNNAAFTEAVVKTAAQGGGFEETS
ncbi:MAG TPA: hypothetical protein VE981_20090, partial [Planctomycetota bacterium]|nr:hypothetical protein [Planctomycetota bacterium]